MGMFSDQIKGLIAKVKKKQGDTSKPGHTHGKEGADAQATGGAAAAPQPTSPPSPTENINMKSNFTSQKAQALGADLFQGQEMVQQQTDIKNMRSTPSNLPGGREEPSSKYGDVFANSPMNQGVSRSDITKANKKRRQDRRQRKQDIKTAGGPESYSADGYHVGEYDKSGRNKQYPEKRYSKKNPPNKGISGADMMSMQFHGYTDVPDSDERKSPMKQTQKSKMQTAQNDPKLQEGSDASYGISGYVNTKKEYKQALQKKNHPYIYDSPSKSPMNQGFGKYKKGDLMDESDQEESMFKSTNSPGKTISGKRYNVENVSDIQVDKKGQFMTTLGDNEYYGMEKRPTSSRVTNYDQGRNAVRDTLRPSKGKKFKKLY